MTLAATDADGLGAPYPDLADVELSLVRDDAAYRVQRQIGLIPATGMGVRRRAFIFAMVAWLPLMLWAAATGQPWSYTHEDGVLAHFGVHVRCLVAIPLFVVAEHIAQSLMPPVFRYFVKSGLVPLQDLPAFSEMLAGVVRLRDNVLPWVLILGLVLATATAGAIFHQYIDMGWPGATSEAGLNFGAWWLVLVVRPLFTMLLLAWLWRALMVLLLFARLARFPLKLVPTHPDHRAGLAFLQRLALIFSPVTFAISAVIAASFAHEVVYHNVAVGSIKGEMLTTAILVSAVFIIPFLPMALLLAKSRRLAIREYGILVSRHNRLVHRRWINGEDITAEIGSPDLLDAPELGPVADVQTLYDAVRQMRKSVLGKQGFAAIILPTCIPLLVVMSLQLPIKDVLAKVLKALV